MWPISDLYASLWFVARLIDMDFISEFFQSENFRIVSSIASIASLLLTILIFINLRRIRSYYLFTARVPELADQLKAVSSKLAGYLNEFDDFVPQITLELAGVEVTLLSLSRKVDGRTKRSVNSLLKSVRAYDPKAKDSEALWDIYVDMHKVVVAIEDLQQDKKCER